MKVLFFIAALSPTNVEQELIDSLEALNYEVGVRTVLQDASYGGNPELADGLAKASGTTYPDEYLDEGEPIYDDVTPAAVGADATVANGATVAVVNSVGTAQVETATAVGTITTSGLASVIVTSAVLTGSPITVLVPVLEDDTAAVWAGKVRTALADNVEIATHFTVSGTGADIVLTAKLPAANDATLNIALADSTSAGITEDASSTDTTAGVAVGNSDNGTARVVDGVVSVVLPATKCVVEDTQVVTGVTLTGTGTTATFTVAAGVITAVSFA